MQVQLSLPAMVYPGSQVQWVVPCTVEQRDGRTWGPLVAAGKTVAAEAAEVFVVVIKTEQRGEENWVKVFVVIFSVRQQLRVRPTPLGVDFFG